MVTVVLQVLMQMMEKLPPDTTFMNTLIRKLAPPLGEFFLTSAHNLFILSSQSLCCPLNLRFSLWLYATSTSLSRKGHYTSITQLYCLLRLLHRPDILKDEIKVFFVKYNDPIYVKLEKLDIMIRLCNSQNIGPVLSELKEYAYQCITMCSSLDDPFSDIQLKWM